MILLLFLLIILFVAVPYDAQLQLISAWQWLWSDYRTAIEILIALSGPTLFYVLGWNRLASRLWTEDRDRADTAYRARRR